jgi:hypothetical protein
MICAYFIGNEISENGEAEKQFMNQAMADCR